MILTLPMTHFKSLLSRDQLLVEEIEVFRVVRRWIEWNNPTAEEEAKLLGCVRLPQIPSNELVGAVASSGLYGMSSIYKAMEMQTSTIAIEQMMPRGKIGPG